MASPVPGQTDAGSQTAPQRLVSLNLCTDQLLLALADRKQIAGLSPNATDPGLSAAAAKAKGLPLHAWSAEELLAINPDLVLGMPASGSSILRALPDRHYPTLDLAAAESLPEILTQIGQVASAIGQPQRGRALVTRIAREVEALPKPGRGRVAAYYQRGGFLSGSGTLVDELMARAGLVNLARRLGKGPLLRLSIEELVAAKPDFLILDSESKALTDEGTQMLRHPALRNIRRIYLPQAWTVCAGPAYTAAIRHLTTALQH